MLEGKGPDDIVLIYPTPVLRRAIPDTLEINKRLRDIVLRRCEAVDGQPKSNIGGWQSSRDIFTWPHPEIKQLFRWVVEAVQSMTRFTAGTVDVSDKVDAQGWANVSGYGAYNKPHIHSGCMWSGVYYVDAGTQPQNNPDSGVIEFMDPRAAINVLPIPGMPFSDKFRVEPQSGMILLFPSWMYHYVNAYQGEGVRISISFNVRVSM